MKKSKILITGASGCVGQYITNWLLENTNAELLLLVRDPFKLTGVNRKDHRIEIIVGDLREIRLFSDKIKSVTRVIHTATAWGDPKRALDVNVIAVKQLLDLLDRETIEQIIYFSTASILKNNLDLLPEAITYGTEYIQTKAKCLEELKLHPLASKIVAVFPTLVFGGRVDGQSTFPTSYLTAGLLEANKWLWLARWLKADSRFHFIHASDIAFICGHLATSPHTPNSKSSQKVLTKYVLAQPFISISDAINTLLDWNGMKKTPGLPLWDWLIEILINLLRIQINPWDRFSIKQRHFDHEPITRPEDFGGISNASTLEAILSNSGLPRLKRGRRLNYPQK